MSTADQVFDWANRLTERANRVHRLRELSQAIHDGENHCGSCEKWMTDACPHERRDKRGQKIGGPSCRNFKCGEFVMQDWDAKRIAGLKAELADVHAKLATKDAA